MLFSDVGRSMDIAAAVGPERLREIMTELFDRSAAVVQKYGGTVDKFIGDGIMALFGAPVALEDHALRACLAALDIQDEAKRLASEVADRDQICLELRVGLNSGEVIAGDIGSKTMSYTVVGEQVGFAQRMESVAPGGGVMLSESTARLVEHATRLGGPELVAIKGAIDPVLARRLMAVTGEPHRAMRTDITLVGRTREMTLLDDMLDQALEGRGCVALLNGPPGIGKSRVAREAAGVAAARGVDVVATYCESHSSGIPFHAVAGLLRGFFGIDTLTPDAARQRTRAALTDTDAQDMVLLDDLLGIRDGGSIGFEIDPDARRRRLATLLEKALLSRREPALYVIEDAHWIDAVSESMLANFISVVPRTPTLVLITHRPEYVGTLDTTPDPTTISLEPLGHAHATALAAELLGSDVSVAGLAQRIAERAAGNPFFTEEIVRDLSERHVLDGGRGAYVCRGDADVSVPATVQATIAARIDRLSARAKRTLNAAAVIGSRFDNDLLSSILDDVALPELVAAELVQRVATLPEVYAFQHPLVHAVAYESQLRINRARLHRTIVTQIERRDPESVDKNAALVANHLESAGDLHAAFAWHMRAGTWATHRDIVAARMSWKRAIVVADCLPRDDPDRLSMRIAPRTLLCTTLFRVGGELSESGFDELRELTAAADDKRSLAIGMAGQVQLLNFHGQYAEASQRGSEFVELLEAIGDPELTVAMMFAPIVAKWDVGEMAETMRLCDRVIDLAGGDPTMGNLVFGSPLAFAMALRASASCCVGLGNWREDLDRALQIARGIDEFTYNAIIMFKYITISNGALLSNDEALRETAEALDTARTFGDDFLLTNAEFTRGLVLVRRDGANREQGFQLLAKCRRVALDHRYTVVAAWCADLEDAAERNRVGDYDGAIGLCSSVLDREVVSGELLNRGWATTVLVEALLNRGQDCDLQLAQAAVDRLAAMPTEPVYLYHELPLLRLTAILARARGDESGFRFYRDQYCCRARTFGFEGHVALAEAMS